MLLGRLAAGLAILAAGACAVLDHPLFRATDALSHGSRALAGADRASAFAMVVLGAADAGGPAAAATFAISVALAGAAGLWLLAPKAAPAESSMRVPIAALAGHLAGSCAVLLGGAGWCFYAVACALAAVVLLVRTASATSSRAGSARTLGLLLSGLLLYVAAGWGDDRLRALTGVRAFPEAWFVIASESGAGWARVQVLAPAIAAAAMAFGMERAPGGLLVSAAAWTLLLGPTNPCHGLALAIAHHRMAAAGVSVPVRAGFVVALVAGYAALAVAS